MPPVSHRFEANPEAALMKQVFAIEKGEREANEEHHREADDRQARFEIAKWIITYHDQKVRNRPACLNKTASGTALVISRARRYLSLSTSTGVATFCE